jgi:hypothetical protein
LLPTCLAWVPLPDTESEIVVAVSAGTALVEQSERYRSLNDGVHRVRGERAEAFVCGCLRGSCTALRRLAPDVGRSHGYERQRVVPLFTDAVAAREPITRRRALAAVRGEQSAAR